MSETEHSSNADPRSDRSEIETELSKNGLNYMAEFLNGPVRINELEQDDFEKVVARSFVVRLRNDNEEVQFALATNDELIQIRDGDRDGEFARPMQAYDGEFGDYVFSGDYQIDIIQPEESAFEVRDA